jgi:restriction endonuclease control protein
MNTMSDKNNDLIFNVGITIAKLRNKNNLSQEGLSELAEIHRTYLSEVEGGKRNPTLTVLKRIVDALGLSMSEFFRIVEENSLNE